MARFDVYRNVGRIANEIPYFLDVQSSFIDDIETRVVIPLARAPKLIRPLRPRDLTPAFEIRGEVCVLSTPMIFSMPTHGLRSKVTSLKSESQRITASLDILFQGY